MLDVSGRNRAIVPSEDFSIKLRQLDEMGDSDQIVLLSVGRTAQVSIDTQMLIVFHAWKSGKLDLIRLSLQNSEVKLDADVDLFLLCHELRVAGQKEDSLKILKELASRHETEIVQYRYVADYLEFGSLAHAFKLMESLITKLPPHRAATIRFNYGIAALNQNLYSVTEDVLTQLRSTSSPLTDFFYQWLSGQYLAKKTEYQASIAPFKKAIEIGLKIPSRSTDLAIVAANLLTSAFWMGDVDVCHEAFEIIRGASTHRKNVLGVNRHIILTAMIDIIEGHLVRGHRALATLFESPIEFTRDHLNASFLYLWSSFATQSRDFDLEVIAKLETKRDELAQSREYYDFSLFTQLFKYLAQKISHDEFATALNQFTVKKSYTAHGFHQRWADALAGFFNEDTYEGLLNILAHLKDFPILERLAILSTKQRANVGFWRLASQRITDQTTRHLAHFQLGYLTHDPVLIARTLGLLKKFQATAWLNSFICNPEFATRLKTSRAVVNLALQKVASLSSGENLDSQPQVAQLFIFFLEQPRGIDKEALTLGLGYKEYDPAQHDPLIHNLIARLRTWLSKNVPDVEVEHSARGWSFSAPELILILDTFETNDGHATNLFDVHTELPLRPSARMGASAGSTLSSSSIAADLHPRLQWIIEQLNRKRSITRAEVLAQFSVKKSTVVVDFNTLLEKHLIRRRGSGRGVYYELQGDPP